jgi:hypothetical protein
LYLKILVNKTRLWWYPDISGGSVGPKSESEGRRSSALGGCFSSLVAGAVFRGGCNQVVAFGMKKHKQ